MKKFFVCRAVNRADGTTAAPVESTETRAQSESLFYMRCSQAVTAIESGESLSEAVIWFSCDGFVIDSKGWRGPDPEPTPTQA